MFARVRKAVLAGFGAAVSALVTAAVQKGDWHLGLPEVGAAVVLGLAAGLAVWRVPNAGPKPPEGVTGRYTGNL
jgi:hypothetical protein